MIDVTAFPDLPGSYLLAGVPEGQDALLLAALVREGRDVLHVARDDQRLSHMLDALAFFAPDIEPVAVPAWDCLPYDRVSPRAEIASRRLNALVSLAVEATRPPPRQKGSKAKATPQSAPQAKSAPQAQTDGEGAAAGSQPGRLILSTVASALQRVPPRDALAGAGRVLRVGAQAEPEDLIAFLQIGGFQRAETVSEPGEFAMRGGILDLFPPGYTDPVRLDFFGDSLEAIRAFDPSTQRSGAHLQELILGPVSEVILSPEAVQRFRVGYRTRFGTGDGDDPLYEAVSAGRRYGGMEHWLPLFHEHMETLFDYLPAAMVVLDPQSDAACTARQEMIADYFQARFHMRASGKVKAGDGPSFNPLPPELLYVAPEEWQALLDDRVCGRLHPFDAPDDAGAVVHFGARPAQGFAEARNRQDMNLFDAVRSRIQEEQQAGRRVVIAAFTEGSRDRLRGILKEHGIEDTAPAESWHHIQTLPRRAVALAVLPIDQGFTSPSASLYSEQDILGDRLARPARKRHRAEAILTELSALSDGDHVVHIDHGIGQYIGLETIAVGGAPHDCLCVVYDGGDKLYVPVENIDVLSRYGAADSGAVLDRLGGAAWQARRAKVKKRIRDMAEALIKVAAMRETRSAAPLEAPDGAYEEFASRFPYPETEDQLRAIGEVFEDLGSGRPMDRLICGDVGFGKTEVALRAAFIAVMSGMQVAVVVPTTLLSRQHYRTFRDRFQGLPVRVEQLSRFVPPREQSKIKADLAAGQVDIVVGTHALLGKGVTFRDLGLLIIDEEQHFGVKQKERLKQMRAEVHVLTLTATPIPRTLQLAMAGVREMSLIATPPVDRLAVRTFVMPYDPVVIREAILREQYRGGQTFYVCPRIEDLEGIQESLGRLVPEVKVALAHGRMAAKDLDDVMNAFYDGQYDVLLSTNIVESGLDVPTANTLILHRSDMFGLAQLYQLRGRIGRSKQRAYAYFTLQTGRILTETARKRLHVMQTLDGLGAGFTLASHDMDIRGAGNLLGEEQSGHVKEVGVELYQQMLEEAVAEARAQGLETESQDESWSPQINLGMPVLIPDTYVADLNLRLGLYRRLASLAEQAEIDAFAAELIDRFGSLPAEVENLLKVVAIKQACRTAGVEKFDAGPKGAVITFRNNQFSRPDRLVAFIQKQAGMVKLRPDHKLVYMRNWEEDSKRVIGAHRLMTQLAKFAV